MRNIIKIFLSLFIVVLCILIIQKIQVSDTTTTIDTIDYWLEEEIALLYLYYIK